MTKIIPLKGLRPYRDIAAKVASLPYDILTDEEVRNFKKEEHSFYHVTRSEIDLPNKVDIYSPDVYAMAKENLNHFIKEGIFDQDREASYYIYRLTMNDKQQTGLIACSSIEDYNNGIIKKHELTRPEKELDRTNHIKATRAQTGIVAMAYNDVPELTSIIESWKVEHVPDYEFTAEDGIQHSIWALSDYGKINTISDIFERDVPTTYISDGHHLAAAGARVAEEMTKQGLSMTGEESFNYFLSCLFPASELNILPYNRIIKDLNGLSPTEFLNELQHKFIVESKGGAESYQPTNLHEFSMYLNGIWYLIKPKPEVLNSTDPVLKLDVSILQNYILSEILAISDPRIDKRMEFVSSVRGLNYMADLVNKGKYAVAFALFPVSIQEIFDVANENKIMPPKSTWFEPKTRDGLIINQI